MNGASCTTKPMTQFRDLISKSRPPSQSTRTKIQANFQIARPPPKSSLRLAPKLLLQIQQLAPNHRPKPVLEIWQPPFRKSKLTKDFHHKPKLRSGDIYATLDEPYITCSAGSPKHSTKSGTSEDSEGNAPNKDVVAAMCQGGDGQSTQSTIHFRDAQRSWQASAGSTGPDRNTPCYRFTIKDENRDTSDPGRMILQWEKRPAANKTESHASPSDSEQFVLVLIDRKARRKSRIATMTPAGLEIVARKSSILEHLRICLDLTEPVGAPKDNGRDCYERLEVWLYTQVLTLGVWVAYQDGWLN